MFNKLFLPLTLTAISFTALATMNEMDTINQKLTNIARAKNDCILELQTALTIAKKAEVHFQSVLGDNYESCKAQIGALLKAITDSEEFTVTVQDVTDAYITYIIDQNIRFNNITIDPDVYTLKGKVDAVLAQASPILDEHGSKLFNTIYVAVAIAHGSKILINKLNLKKEELLAALAALEAANQTATE